MLQLVFPSKEFAAAWVEALTKRKDFCVEARIGRLRRKSIQAVIDFVLYDGTNGFGMFCSIFLCGQLNVCVTKAIGTKQYEINYSETETGTSITFSRKVPGGDTAKS